MRVLALCGAVIFVDQASKYCVMSVMSEGVSVPVLSGIFHITYILNAGAAFGIMENQRGFFIAIACVLLVFFVMFYRKLLRQPRFLQTGAALLAGGAAGNLIDRVKTGKVVDFFDFIIWPVFNIADIAICLGAVCILWTIAREKEI